MHLQIVGCSFNEIQFSGSTVGWNLLHVQVPGIFAVNNGLENLFAEDEISSREHV